MIKTINKTFAYRFRKLASSSAKRAMRWEFWPMWIFYIPVVLYILFLTIRYRGLSFTAVNPGLPGSGFIGENKSLSLSQIQDKKPTFVAKTKIIVSDNDISLRLSQCQGFMSANNLDYPIILKPDFGQRGMDVNIVRTEDELTALLGSNNTDWLIQEYIAGVEFGVFYVREPDQDHGRIFSVTHKCFPSVTGDGVSTLEVLILEHPRLHYMAAFLLEQYKDQLHLIPSANEVVEVIKLGSHCQGSLFLDGDQYLTDELADTVDAISRDLDGFYFGRYDIRAKDIEAFQRGDIKVIEVNGVTSESTNIYDPKYTLFTAYRILFSQWDLAFKIGKKNMLKGFLPMTIGGLIDKVRFMREA